MKEKGVYSSEKVCEEYLIFIIYWKELLNIYSINYYFFKIFEDLKISFLSLLLKAKKTFGVLELILIIMHLKSIIQKIINIKNNYENCH